MNTVRVELQAPGQLTYQPISLSETPLGAQEVFARTLVSVVSPGTEMAAYAGLPPLRPGPVYPRLLGYCNVAEVLEIGSEVADVQVGDRILTFQSHCSHFRCPYSDMLAVISPELTSATAATAYLFHLGYAALLKGQLQPGWNVAVVGLGTLGLTTLAVSIVLGARTVGFSNQPSSRERALQWGAWQALAKNDQSADAAVRQVTAGDDFDLVINTSNAWDDWRLALELARAGGTIINLGFPGREEPVPPFNPLDSRYFYDKQLTIAAGGMMPNLEVAPQHVRHTIKRNLAYLLDLIGRNRLPAGELISEFVAWHELETVYQHLQAQRPDYLTAALDWTRP